jgi:putative transposase
MNTNYQNKGITMKIIELRRSTTVKLYPNKKQKQIIDNMILEGKYVWNKTIEYLKKHTREQIFKMGKYGVAEYEKSIRPNGIQSQASQAIAYRAYSAFKEYYLGKRGLPKLKELNVDKGSITFPQIVGKLYITNNLIKLPKIGIIRCSKNKIKNPVPEIAERIKVIYKTITIKKVLDTYYAVISLILKIEYFPMEPMDENNTVGIDIGTINFIADSNGNKIKTEEKFKDILMLHNKLKRVYNILSKKLVKNDNKLTGEIKKIIKLINRINTRIVNKRKDKLHKISRKYVNLYNYIAVENLKIKRMTRKATEGKEKYTKKKLNREMLMLGVSQFLFYLEYKLQAKNGMLIRVEPEYTSQRCSVCGTIRKENRDGRIYKCNVCGNVIDADINAAINIKDLALGRWNNKVAA